MVAAWIGGRLDRAYGPKPVITWSIVVLILVCLIIVGMTRESSLGSCLSTLPLRTAGPDLFRLWRPDWRRRRLAAGGISHDDGAPHHTGPRDRGFRSFRAFGQGRKLHVARFLIALFTTISGSQRIGIAADPVLFLIGLDPANLGETQR